MVSAETGAADRLGHRPALDGLRGIAVALVVLSHLEVPGLVGGGAVGVTLFFTLSGYLITKLLLEEVRIDLAAFYQRRARRLLPALAVVLAVCVPLLSAGQLGSIVFYAGNWWRVGGGDLGPLNHTWSLAVEEQFYLLWPLVLVCLPRHAWKIAVAGIVTAVVLRPVLWSGAEDVTLVQFSTFTRIDAILAGSLLAITGRRLRGGAVALPMLLALTVFVGSGAFLHEWGFTLITIVSVVAVGSTVTAPLPVLHGRVIGWLGRRSYGLYLWHFPLIVWLRPEGWGKVAVVTLALVVTEASWRVVERRFVSAGRPRATTRP